MPKISFILPTYKAEKYLPQVVESLKNQTMPDFEAIFVDDGSPDNSAAVLKRLFDGDERFLLVSKQNGGVSSARNAGLDRAVGKYILFVDPDDKIEPKTAEVLLENAERENADLVFFGRVNDCYVDGKLVSSTPSLPKIEGVFRDKPCQTHFDAIATAYFVTDKLFKRENIEKYNIRFKDMNIGEDGVFFAEYIRQGVDCAVFLREAFYRYTVDGSATLSSSYHAERETDNFRLSDTIRQTVEAWGLSESKSHADAVAYCTVRDLQLGIKNIALSSKPFCDKVKWLKNAVSSDTVSQAVSLTALSKAESRNDKIKLLLLKCHAYRTVIFISQLNQKRGKNDT